MMPLRSSPNGAGDGSFDGGSDSSGGSKRGKRRPPRITDKNLYEILGASPTMSRSEIKRLYISLAKEYHPDSAPSSIVGATAADGSDRFNDVAQAWSVLSDPKSRRAYDRELAAQGFKEDVVKRAGEVAREYGPTARKFYEEYAIPFLRRSAATTLAGWSAVASEVGASDQQQQQQRDRQGAPTNNGRDMMFGATSSDLVREASEAQRRRSGGDSALEDFGRAFQRVIEAAGNATRQIDGTELREKSLELRRQADGVRAESMAVLERLTEIKAERLRLTVHTPSANFSSAEAVQYLEGFDDGKGSGPEQQLPLMQRMMLKHPIRQDIEAFASAEDEYQKRAASKNEVDVQMQNRRRALLDAENDARLAAQAEERARKMLEEAQFQVAESQRAVVDAQRSVRDLDSAVRRADQELSKADAVLRRKRDVVRRELKRKSNEVSGSVFDTEGGSGRVRLNPGFDRSSMSSMGFEGRGGAEAIERLKRDERRVEGEFLGLVDKASRLVSRSERLRLRSEELIGSGEAEERQQAATANTGAPPSGGNRGTVIGDTFEGITEEMVDAAQISNDAWRDATMNSVQQTGP